MDPYLTPHTKANSKRTKNLHIRPRTVKLLGEHTRQKLHGIGSGNDFLAMPPKVQGTKLKTDHQDFMKIKTFCAQRTYESRAKATHRMGDSIYKSYVRNI